MITPPPEPTQAAAPEPASYLKSQAAYQESLKHYEEQKEADAKRYEEQQAKYNAELKAQQAREAQIAAVRSTPGGSQTAPTSKPVVKATAQPTPAPASKPTAQATAQWRRSRPPSRTQKKPVRKATPPPDERPRFY